MKPVVAAVIPTSLGGTLDENTLNPEQKLMLAAQKKTQPMKRGGMVRSSASKRADGIAQRGKTRGKMV